MRLKLALAPTWVIGLVQGVLFGAAMSVFARLYTGSWWPAVIGGAVGGSIFGFFMGPMISSSTLRATSCDGAPPKSAASAVSRWSFTR